MTEQTKQTIHPMAASMYTFVNEALTMEELEARLNLMKSVIAAIDSDLVKLKNPQVEAEEAVPVEVVEADEVIESPEEARARKIAEYAATLDAEEAV